MQIDGFIDKDEFRKQTDDWIHVFRNTKPAPGTNGPLIPGDPEREAEAIRSKEGIPLLKPVVDDLLDIAKRTGIPSKEREPIRPKFLRADLTFEEGAQMSAADLSVADRLVELLDRLGIERVHIRSHRDSLEGEPPDVLPSAPLSTTEIRKLSTSSALVSIPVNTVRRFWLSTWNSSVIFR